MFKQNDIANLENIIWAISKIENSIKNISSAIELLKNEEKYDSVLIKIMNIGESANNISEELKNKNGSIEWSKMYRMRNIISHSYHAVDENITWNIITKELPNNKLQIAELLTKLK